MNSDQRPALSIEADLNGTQVRVLERGTIPTVHVRLGSNVTVEVDITKTHAPISITIQNPRHSAVVLCDLLGTATAHELILRATNPGEHLKDIGRNPLTFEAGPAWAGLLAAAYQEWILFWNPLPFEPSIAALDMVAASHQNRAFGGAEEARKHAPEALSAVRMLQNALKAGLIRGEALQTVLLAIDAFEANFLPGTPKPEIDPVHPELISESTQTAFLRNDSPLAPSHDVILTGSPDWRLTGHGPLSTSEDSIWVHPHHRNSTAITVTAHTSPTAKRPFPAYEALITEPHTGDLIAYTTLISRDETLVSGHAIPSRPIRTTDHVDIRHPLLHGNPETNPERRDTERARREAARSTVRERLHLSDYSRAIPPTLSELALNGRLFLSTGTGDNGKTATAQSGKASRPADESPLTDDFDWFLFELSTSSHERTDVSRGSQDAPHNRADAAKKKTFTSPVLTDSAITASFDTDGTTLRATLRRYPHAGHHVGLMIVLDHPDGSTSTYTTDTQLSGSRGVPLKYKLTEVRPESRIISIGVRAHR
ncbi:hypothetical protein DM793_04000 [Paenarthrobacter nitroguajacolicus]|uniref:hypothetical protein n=1 Tax=Paenarthrobacter nitroguajacolicus TaxID=211146 RepID=UPI0015BBE904|nr:hypothetical protein [Paenarthrobacter nitroguajacolicus]NWL10465.1 hypothetical protein [Paenarthrobacter nitroguajacolicus]